MIEMMAMAICLAGQAPDEDRSQCASICPLCLAEARAALEPMLKPTEAMIAVGNEALLDGQPVDYIFRAMINAAMESHDCIQK